MARIGNAVSGSKPAPKEKREPLGSAAVDQEPPLRVETLGWGTALCATAAASAATSTATTPLRSLGIDAHLGYGSVVVVSRPIVDPLTYVAKHVIEAPLVRLLQAHRMRLVIGVIGEPSVVAQGSSRRVWGTSASGVFPLRFGR